MKPYYERDGITIWPAKEVALAQAAAALLCAVQQPLLAQAARQTPL